MKKFIIRTSLFLLIPVLTVLAIYIATDPFKTIRPFSLEYFDTTNRDYLSTELFLRNSQSISYNSFIFGSSRCGGINSYHWKAYLPDNCQQFVFQAWSETLTGILQKIEYLDMHEVEIQNALVLLDIPGSFVEDQLPKQALTIKDYHISGQPFLLYQAILFIDFLSKPSLWINSIRSSVKGGKTTPGFDIVSNDWSRNFVQSDISVCPQKDSLNNCSNVTKKTTFKEIQSLGEESQTVSEALICSEYEVKLRKIKEIFDKQNTSFSIIITPAIWQLNSSINPNDLQLLHTIFGDRVYDYSGENYITDDIGNFSDPNHFGPRAGWLIIEDIFNSCENQK